MSMGAMIGSQILDKGIDQFTTGVGFEHQKWMANKDRKQQQLFARQGLKWKIKQAREMGLHPALALGASTPTYSPVGVGVSFARHGQGLGAALSRLQTTAEKNRSVQEIAQSKELTRSMALDNELKQIELDNLKNPPLPDGSPSLMPGQSQMPTSMKGQMFDMHSNVSKGVAPMEKYYVDRDNNVVLLLDEKASEAMENDPFAKTVMFGNKAARVARSWNYYFAPGTKKAMRFRENVRRFRKSLGQPPKGYQFSWSPEKGAFKLEKYHGSFYTRGIGGQLRHRNIRY